MASRSRHRILSALAGGLLLQACAGGTAPPTLSPDPARGEDPAAVSDQVVRDRPDLERLEALYNARKAEALENVHEADVAFITGMISHHAQALVMSRVAPDAGASQTIRTLTARIINAQSDEIANMQRWLRDRGLPVPVVHEDGRMGGMEGAEDAAPMHDAHAAHDPHALMPGMLSQQQLDELLAARGEDYDRLFLTYMIQHHQGAVTMVHELFATDGAAQDDFIFKIASDIQVDQITEINRMQLMLDAMN